MARVDDLFPAGQLASNMPLMAIRVPSVGTITRRERDEVKAFGSELGLRVFDDVKRLDRDFPQPMQAVRDAISFEEGDLLRLQIHPRRFPARAKPGAAVGVAGRIITPPCGVNIGAAR